MSYTRKQLVDMDTFELADHAYLQALQNDDPMLWATSLKLIATYETLLDIEVDLDALTGQIEALLKDIEEGKTK